MNIFFKGAGLLGEIGKSCRYRKWPIKIDWPFLQFSSSSIAVNLGFYNLPIFLSSRSIPEVRLGDGLEFRG